VKWLCAVLLSLALGAPLPSAAADLYPGGAWPALASDRPATRVGDILTVIIYENSLATNSVQSTTHKNTHIGGQVKTDDAVSDSADLALSGTFDGGGQNGRSGRIVAQISVTVDQVLANGDLHVSGEQVLNIAGDRTDIRLRGRVRPQDIANDNTILSTRLADVTIDYDGHGYVTRSGKPGIVNRIFSFLGLI
jgi:flagellar L-ring protein precursor FlgH